MWLRFLPLVAAITLTSSCGPDGCFDLCGPPYTHHAVVNGTVLDTSGHPLSGMYSSIRFPGDSFPSAHGTQSDARGRFTVTARTSIPASGPDTVRAWVRATAAIPPPGQPVTDSVEVLLHFKPRTEPANTIQVTLHLAVSP